MRSLQIQIIYKKKNNGQRNMDNCGRSQSSYIMVTRERGRRIMPWFDEIILDDLDDELNIHENSDYKKEKWKQN